jgi:Tol biopolymer transport system component
MRHHALALSSLVCALLLAGCRMGVDFSPDGRRMVITRRSGLILLNVDGSGKQVVPDGEDGSDPHWSPDGRHILFQKGMYATSKWGEVTFEDEPDVMLYDVQRHSTRIIVPNLGSPLAWREDGARFAAVRQVGDAREELMMCSLPDGAPVLEVRLPAKISVGELFWIPGTDDLVCIAGNDHGNGVYLIEGGELRKITASNNIVGLGISPDGKRVLWARQPEVGKTRVTVYAYNLSDRAAVPLSTMSVPVPKPKLPRSSQSWLGVFFSPDCRKLALVVLYTTGPRRQPNKGHLYSYCYTLNLDGGGVRPVHALGPPRQEGLLLPQWSHDGKRLAVTALTKGYTRVTVYNADGSGGKLVSTEKGDEGMRKSSRHLRKTE